VALVRISFCCLACLSEQVTRRGKTTTGKPRDCGHHPGRSIACRVSQPPLTDDLVDGDYDLFGDGTLVLIPTYGHTPGHQLLWMWDGQAPPLVFTGDTYYTQERLDRDVLPQAVWNADAMAHALTTLRNLRDTHGATLFYGHDPGQ
jgi:glyoxylase-like metal-dependent hydrolase (beta-lactamase superfamily II)